MVQFSSRMSQLKGSAIRELLALANKPEVLSFAGGMPAPELFPVDKIKAATDAVLEEQGKIALQYSSTNGFEHFRQQIADRMEAKLNIKTSADNILVTSGSQQGLDYSARVFCDKGDVVIIESPSYLGALNAFKACEPNFVAIPTDGDGMIMEELEKVLATTENVKMIYVIPDFQNPSGRTWPLERRKQFMDIINKYEIPVVEDNPYGAPKPVKNAPYISKPMAVILGAIAICLPILGIFPHQTQDALAAMGAHFMNAHTPAHAVHYFAWVNLKGAVISICVGIVVYFLFIRKVLMQKDANGNLVYVDRWPEWCNLEDKVYRPILLTVLPYVGGFFARIAGNLMDDIIALLRIFIFNNDNGRIVPPEDKYFSAYTDYENDHQVYREGFAQSILLIGLGLTIAVIYIIV